MQSESPLPPNTTPPTEPSMLEEMAALTGLFNPEIIWKEEEILDNIEAQEARQAPAPASPAAPATEQP